MLPVELNALNFNVIIVTVKCPKKVSGDSSSPSGFCTSLLLTTLQDVNNSAITTTEKPEGHEGEQNEDDEEKPVLRCWKKMKMIISCMHTYFIHNNIKYPPEELDNTWKAEGSSGSRGAGVGSSGHISGAWSPPIKT